MRSIALLSEKGGTGKTTTAINLAAGLARRGHRALLVDCDPQANASYVLLEGRGAESPTLSHVLLGHAEAVEAIRPTNVEGLDVLPADALLADANLALAGELGRERRLRLAMLPMESGYDFVILDTSPTRSLVNVNVLNYAGEVLVPVDPSIFSLAGLGRLQEAVAEVTRYLDNRRLYIAGLVLTRCQNNKVSRDVEAQLRELFGELVHRASIPHSIKVEEAHGRFQAVLDWAPRSAGAKAYDQLVTEVLDHGRAQERTGPAAGGPVAADDADAA